MWWGQTHSARHHDIESMNRIELVSNNLYNTNYTTGNQAQK